MSAAELEAIRAAMLTAPDVMRVLALEEHGPGAVLYLIETPHSFPRFVIGRTDPALKEPAILRGCGEEWNAWEAWREERTGAPATVGSIKSGGRLATFATA